MVILANKYEECPKEFRLRGGLEVDAERNLGAGVEILLACRHEVAIFEAELNAEEYIFIDIVLEARHTGNDIVVNKIGKRRHVERGMLQLRGLAYFLTNLGTQRETLHIGRKTRLVVEVVDKLRHVCGTDGVVADAGDGIDTPLGTDKQREFVVVAFETVDEVGGSEEGRDGAILPEVELEAG